MAKITYRKVNEHSWINNTFLQPYCGYITKLVEYKNGRIDLHIEGGIIHNVQGTYTSEYNGWDYTVKKILGRPLAFRKKMNGG